MSEWQRIETAPKDGTEIDLWVVEKFVRHAERNTDGERVAGCKWRCGLKDYDDYGECWRMWSPPYWEAVEHELSGGSRYATHWMPLPKAPLEWWHHYVPSVTK